MSTTSDRNDPRLTCGADEEPVPQAEAYLVLSDEERRKGFVQPVRSRYVHLTCGTVTTMNQGIAETYARQPYFYGATYCVFCQKHRPVGEDGEFIWDDGSGQKVGTTPPPPQSDERLIGPVEKCDRCGNHLKICGHNLSFKEKMKSISVQRLWANTK